MFSLCCVTIQVPTTYGFLSLISTILAMTIGLVLVRFHILSLIYVFILNSGKNNQCNFESRLQHEAFIQDFETIQGEAKKQQVPWHCGTGYSWASLFLL